MVLHEVTIEMGIDKPFWSQQFVAWYDKIDDIAS